MRARIILAVLVTATACRVPCSQGPAPYIVGSVSVAADSAKVSVEWYTSRPATTLVEYGATQEYGTTYEVKALEAEHRAYLSGLVPGATYHYRVRSVDGCGLEVISADATFTVPGGTVSTGGGGLDPPTLSIEDTASLPAPVPIPVPDFVTGGAGGPVTFEWEPVKVPAGKAVEYLVQVSWSPDFSQVSVESGWIEATQWTTNLGATGTWYWRVQARDSKHPDVLSAWTPVQSFYDIMEIKMKGSCPFLFVRDVSGWHYQTEIQGPAIGLPESVLTTRNIRLYHPEHVVLEGMQKDDAGSFRVKIRETQREITYLDRLTLLVVDHPAGHGIVASTAESTYSYGYADPFEIVTTGPAARPPISAKDTTGKDVLESLTRVDGDAYTSTHPTRLVLDLGTLEHPEHARLLVTGWSTYDRDVYPADDLVQPFIEVRGAKGGWVVARSFGNPAGDTKTMAIDLSGLLPEDDHRIRIDMGTVHSIRWAMDRVLVDDSPPAPFVVRAVEASLASLYHAGRAPHSRATHEHPNVVEDGSIPVNQEALGWGAFTRYGDVLELLDEADDMYVVMRHGDALEVSFPDLPPPAPGFHRSLVLEAVLWYKHFTLGDTVDPLPYLGMKTYPDDGYPMDAAHAAYVAEWNTRVFANPGP